MASRKQHPRITVNSSPEQGELSGGEDDYTKEKDAQMKRQREEVQQSKVKESSRTVLTRYPKDPVELDSIREARQKKLDSKDALRKSPPRQAESSRAVKRASDVRETSPNSLKRPRPLPTDVSLKEGRPSVIVRRHSPPREQREQKEQKEAADSTRRHAAGHSRSRDVERTSLPPKAESSKGSQSLTDRLVKMSTSSAPKESVSESRKKSADVSRPRTKAEVEAEVEAETEAGRSRPSSLRSPSRSLSRKSSHADIQTTKVKPSSPLHPPKASTLKTTRDPVSDPKGDPVSDTESDEGSVKSQGFLMTKNKSDEQSEGESEGAEGSEGSEGGEGQESPVYGPVRSKFENEPVSTYGLKELSPSPSPVTPEDVSIEELPDHSGLPPYFPGIDGCRSVDEFECMNRIEEGTYGVVYRARDKRTNEVVALKRLKMEKEKEGFPITSLREVSTLLKAHHPNVVAIKEVVVGHNMDKIYMVMEFVEHDLKALMETMRQPFSIGEVKTLMRQLLSAVRHLHDNWIVHRDLKTSNLLLNHQGVLKVADFGLAREYGSPLRPYTPVVVTLWYRSPELLLGVKEYSTPIDVWSVGCIFAEFLTLKPLFPGKSELEQITKIFKELGNPSEANWPGYSELPLVKNASFVEYPYNVLRKRFPPTVLTNSGYDLLSKLLEYNPKTRITAEDALKHIHFRDVPLPVDPSMFPTWPARSEQGPRAARQNTPKPPSGGKMYRETADDDAVDGFRIGGQKDATTMKGEGFRLKF